MTTSNPRVPRITCPSWCTVSEAAHQADLDNWEGRVIHHGPSTPECWQPWLESPDEDEVMIYDGRNTITLGEARRPAGEILALVTEAGA